MGFPEEYVVGKKMARLVTETWECLEKMMSLDVTGPTEGLRETMFENKILQCGYVLVGGRRNANRADW
jgi:hypothetical protein